MFSDIFSRTYTTPLGSQQTLLLSGASFAAGQGGTAAYDFVSVTAVPEPSTAVLLGLGFVAMIGVLIPFEIWPAGEIDASFADRPKRDLCEQDSLRTIGQSLAKQLTAPAGAEVEKRTIGSHEWV